MGERFAGLNPFLITSSPLSYALILLYIFYSNLLIEPPVLDVSDRALYVPPRTIRAWDFLGQEPAWTDIATGIIHRKDSGSTLLYDKQIKELCAVIVYSAIGQEKLDEFRELTNTVTNTFKGGHRGQASGVKKDSNMFTFGYTHIYKGQRVKEPLFPPVSQEWRNQNVSTDVNTPQIVDPQVSATSEQKTPKIPLFKKYLYMKEVWNQMEGVAATLWDVQLSVFPAKVIAKIWEDSCAPRRDNGLLINSTGYGSTTFNVRCNVKYHVDKFDHPGTFAATTVLWDEPPVDRKKRSSNTSHLQRSI